MDNSSSSPVRVGISVFVKKDENYLFGKRKNSHGDGFWANPGGHLEFGESIEACARREVLEETGLYITTLRFLGVTNDVFLDDAKHYVTIHMLAETNDIDAQLREPEKCEKWGWFEAGLWPNPLFLSIKNLQKENPNLF